MNKERRLSIQPKSLTLDWWDEVKKLNFTVECNWSFESYDDEEEFAYIELEVVSSQSYDDNEEWVDDVSLSDKFLADLRLEAEEEINSDLHTYEMWDWWIGNREVNQAYYNEVW
jgi:hypothetical protein